MRHRYVNMHGKYKNKFQIGLRYRLRLGTLSEVSVDPNKERGKKRTYCIRFKSVVHAPAVLKHVSEL